MTNVNKKDYPEEKFRGNIPCSDLLKEIFSNQIHSSKAKSLSFTPMLCDEADWQQDLQSHLAEVAKSSS